MSHLAKRRRLDDPSGHGMDHMNSMKEELHRISLEVEQFSVKRPEHPAVVAYRPTYRAMLAKKGFLISQTLGAGSYSKVKLALNVDEKLPQKVAIKIIDRLKAPKDYQKKFMPREIHHWPSFVHPNIVQLHRIFVDSRRVYMVVEYAEGGDVLRRIQAHGAVSEACARQWGYQIAGALRYMHDRDITHRDLKLENLLLDRQNNIKLCDFGFIKPDSSQSLSSTFCGSKSYAAPEILQGCPYDPRKSDVWALGVILYIFITGRMPFDETKGTKSILEEHRSLNFRWPKSRKISKDAKDLIKWMFTWSFETRPWLRDIIADPWFSNQGQIDESSLPGMVCSDCNPTMAHRTSKIECKVHPTDDGRSTVPTVHSFRNPLT